LEGSYGYTVPQAVIDVVGGDANGKATLTAPVNTATAGPLATGKPITYTNADGSTTTSVSGPGSPGSPGSRRDGPNVAAIAAGVVAGVLFVVACYLAFCAFIYRKQLQLYKRHVELSQAQARGEKTPAVAGLYPTNTNATSGKYTPSDASYAAGSSGRRGTTAFSEGGITAQGSNRHSSVPSGGASSDGTFTEGYNVVRRNSDISLDEDLLAGHEPTFVGVMLNPRQSLRVINRD
jgi:hypothetical protein